MVAVAVPVAVAAVSMVAVAVDAAVDVGEAGVVVCLRHIGSL
jgi:hypothetical protein